MKRLLSNLALLTGVAIIVAPVALSQPTNPYVLTSAKIVAALGFTPISGVTDATITTSDITTNNSTAAKHGWLPKLSGSASDALKGDGTWATVSSGCTVDCTFTASGNTTPVTITGGTVTASSPPLNITQTWNNAGINFTGIKLNATRTASAGTDLLIDLQLAGASKFKVDRTGVSTSQSTLITNAGMQLGIGSTINFGTAANGTHIGDNSTNGSLLLMNGAENSFGLLIFGGGTASFPALKRSTTGLQARLGDDSNYTTFDASIYSASGTAGIASCTVAVLGATVTIKGGIITAFTGC